MKLHVRAVVAALIVGGTACGGSGAMDLGPPVMSAQVFAADFYYSPSALSLKVGGTVEWFFEGIHDVVFTSGSGAEPSDCPRGVTSCSRTFDVAGAFTYRCTLPGHDAMVGSVTVVP